MDSSYIALPDGEVGEKNTKVIEQTHVEAKSEIEEDCRRITLLDFKSRWIAEAQGIWSLAWVIMVGTLANYSFVIVSLTFVGHLGELELSSSSFAYSIANVTGFYVMVGMAVAVETLCGQSYGAKDYARLGVHLHAALLISLSACIPIGVLWWNLESVLVWIGQDPQLSRMAQSYVRYSIPNLVAGALYHNFLRFLQVQSQVMPMLVCSVITAILHPLICYMIITTLDFGYVGGAVAHGLSSWILIILLASYVFFSGKCAHTWTGIHFWEAVRCIPSFLQLAVPSVSMLCLKLWTFELLLLMSGNLPRPALELSVLSVALNTSLLIWMIPFGFSAAANARISNALGAYLPGAGKITSQVVLVLGATQATVVSIALILTRNWLGLVYTDVEEVVNYVAEVVPLLAITVFVDAIQGILVGILGGCGQQKFGAVVNLGSFYVFGIPVAFALAFAFHLNGTGLLIGLTCGISLQVTILLCYVLRIDWNQMADDAQKRVQHRGRPALATLLG